MANNDTPMNKTSEYFFVTINAPLEKASRETLEAYISTLQSYYSKTFIASVIHDKDKHEDGASKTIHLHAFIDTPNKPTKKALLRELTELLGINEEQVGIRATNSRILLVQYLTHKNDKNKAPYSLEEVQTSNQEEFDKRFNEKYEKPQTETLLEILNRSLEEDPSYNHFCERVGFEMGHKFRSSFNQLREEKSYDYASLLEMNKELKKKLQEQVDLNRHLATRVETLEARLKRLNQENLELYK